MKVTIATFVRAYNYGAVLQAYALNRIINDMGVDCETIDYYPDYFRRYYEKPPFAKLTRPPFHCRYWKGWLERISANRILSKRCRKFDRFLCTLIHKTEHTYTSFPEIENQLPNYDVFISGSDQVWNGRLMEYDPFYYLYFKQANSARKISYSASFGDLEIPGEWREQYRDWFADYDTFSVREPSAVPMLRELTGKDVVVCCDPTLLLRAEDYRAIAAKNREKKPYILVYMVNDSENLLSAAKKLADKTSMKVICVPCIIDQKNILGTVNRKDGYNFDWRSDCSPQEYIALFSGAEYVLASSFHGAVFSILFHKNFLVETEFIYGHNNRAKELLTILGLQKRQLSDNIDSIFEPVTWGSVDERLNVMRNNANRYLREALHIE